MSRAPASPAPTRIVVAGVSHHDAGVATRGRVMSGVRPARVAAALAPGDECVVLSTCDRLEVYAASASPGLADRVLAAIDGADELVVRRDRAAVRHLMRVACGLDSLVVGEHEIQGQVGHAWRQARHAGATGTTLDRLFQQALATAGRVRSTTGLGRGRTSLASVAVERAVAGVPDPRDAAAVVVGVDPVARGIARRLARMTGGRTALLGPHGPATRLADAVGATAPRGEDAIAAVRDARLLVTCAPPDPPVAAAIGRRLAGDPRVLCLDLCVPRAIIGPAGGTVLDLDDLRPLVASAHGLRAADAAAAERVVSGGTAEMMDWLAGRVAAPAIARLTARAEQVRREQLERALRGVDDPEVRMRLERLSRRLTGALIHEPVTRLRRSPDPPTDARVFLRLMGIPERPDP